LTIFATGLFAVAESFRNIMFVVELKNRSIMQY